MYRIFYVIVMICNVPCHLPNRLYILCYCHDLQCVSFLFFILFLFAWYYLKQKMIFWFLSQSKKTPIRYSLLKTTKINKSCIFRKIITISHRVKYTIIHGTKNNEFIITMLALATTAAPTGNRYHVAACLRSFIDVLWCLNSLNANLNKKSSVSRTVTTGLVTEWGLGLER